MKLIFLGKLSCSKSVFGTGDLVNRPSTILLQYSEITICDIYIIIARYYIAKMLTFDCSDLYTLHCCSC